MLVDLVLEHGVVNGITTLGEVEGLLVGHVATAIEVVGGAFDEVAALDVHPATDPPGRPIVGQGVHRPEFEQVLGGDAGVVALFALIVHQVEGVAGDHFKARQHFAGGLDIDAFADDLALADKAA
ncbi:hypothetical protein D3C78_1006910 [compost metagenome]